MTKAQKLLTAFKLHDLDVEMKKMQLKRKNPATTGDTMTSRLSYPHNDIRIISISQPRARKDYVCIGCSSKISKGDRYQRSNFTDDNISMGQKLLSTTACLSCSPTDHPVFGVANGKFRKSADLTWRPKTQQQPVDWYSC